jgi:bifunctional UDP-N-acetylglucosamine pyrophosphorylase/glucosamine-1-phosphate N-acetyltransferase
MAERSCLTVVLAAGEGTRMVSSLPKVLHRVAGFPMLWHVIRAAGAAGSDRLAVVIGPDLPQVEAAVRSADKGAATFVQRDRLGTAHAALAARPALEQAADDVLIAFGDTPLVTADTFQRLRAAIAGGATVAVAGFRAADPKGYGRLVMDAAGVAAIVEEKDATDAERAITLCNGGLMAFDGHRALALLSAVGNANAKGEYYLTDVVALARAGGGKVALVEIDEDEVRGVNTRAQLADVEAIMQMRLRARAFAAGVTLTDPASVHLAADTVIGKDTMVSPHVVFGPGVQVGANVEILPFSHLEGATVGDGARIGPFARLRPEAAIGADAHVGNFVEIKKADIGAGAKVNHLTYIGDAVIGAKANIGAGTITCNYDGFGKYLTEIGAGAFVGSNSALVAPVRVGDGAYVGSGSVVTKDVPAHALAVARGRQSNIEGWAKTFRAGKQKPSTKG